MAVPPDCSLLASESSHGDGWTCTIRIWRSVEGALGVAVIAEHEPDDRSAILMADGFTKDELADRLERVSDELAVPESLTSRAVSRTWASAEGVAWGLGGAEAVDGASE